MGLVRSCGVACKLGVECLGCEHGGGGGEKIIAKEWHLSSEYLDTKEDRVMFLAEVGDLERGGQKQVTTLSSLRASRRNIVLHHAR